MVRHSIAMDPAVLVRLAFPLLLAVGGIAAWRINKRERERDESPPAWRDDSLDDWRRERDADAEARRVERANDPTLATGRAEEQAEQKKHQRVGG